MRTTTALAVWLAIACATGAHAQTTFDIRVNGEHRLASGEAPETARQLALADARRKAWQAAATELQRHAEVKALRLKPLEVEAYTAVLLETQELAAPGTGAAGTARVSLSARVDARDAARLMAALRTDQDASFDLVEAWTGMGERSGSNCNASSAQESLDLEYARGWLRIDTSTRESIWHAPTDAHHT